MALPEARPAAQRKADTLAKLAEPEVDGWVATGGAGADGAAIGHLVPLSLAWLGDRIVVALESASLTARNLTASGQARLGLGPTRDVVIVDAVLERTESVAQAPTDLVDRYVAQAGWDPAAAGDDYVYMVLRPERIQAWREANELRGRTLMRDGEWLV